MGNNIALTITNFLISALAILFAISIHEFGHAYVAHLNGDDTAKNMGRMNINPLSHIDIFGMIMMFIAHFGWAKPVPVNPYNYKNYRIGNISVSLAGIFMNLVSAIVFMNILKHVDNELAQRILTDLVIYNIGFASFNILPIPPLDGWGFISTFLPGKVQESAQRYSQITFLIFIILIVTNKFGIILNPIYRFFTSIVLTFTI